MPHPEAFVDVVTNPYWTRVNITEAQGLKIFKNAVNYLEEKYNFRKCIVNGTLYDKYSIIDNTHNSCLEVVYHERDNNQ